MVGVVTSPLRAEHPCVQNESEVLPLYRYLESAHMFIFFSIYIYYALQQLVSVQNFSYLEFCPCVAVYRLLLAEYSRVQ